MYNNYKLSNTVYIARYTCTYAWCLCIARYIYMYLRMVPVSKASNVHPLSSGAVEAIAKDLAVCCASTVKTIISLVKGQLGHMTATM